MDKEEDTRQEVGECSCGGKIIRVTKVYYKYFGDPMHMIIGPGHRSQLTRVENTETSCEQCGLVYSNSLEPKKKAAGS